jgi:hypothetical protein
MSIDNGIPKFKVSIAGTGVFTGKFRRENKLDLLSNS